MTVEQITDAAIDVARLANAIMTASKDEQEQLISADAAYKCAAVIVAQRGQGDAKG